MMRLTRIGYLLTLVVTFFCCALSARAQILQNERFNPLKIITTGTIQCATNTGIPIDCQLFADPDPSAPDHVVGATAAVKGTTITAKALMNIPGPFREGEVTLIDASYNGIPLSATMDPVDIDTIPTVQHEFTITIGPLPNFVFSGEILVNLKTFEQVDDGFIEGHATVLFHLYTVCDTPKHAMEKPWVGVLEDSCTWAIGKSEKADVVLSLTRGLYNSGAIYYDAASTLSNGAIVGNEFDLITFLASSRPISGQCYDASNYNALCLYSQGVDSVVLKKRALGENPVVFYINSGVLIGWFDFVQEYIWQAHQLVVLRNSTVADPTIGLESRGTIPVALESASYWNPGTNGLVKSIEPGSTIIANDAIVIVFPLPPP